MGNEEDKGPCFGNGKILEALSEEFTKIFNNKGKINVNGNHKKGTTQEG